MDKTEFEAELRRDGFRPVFASLRPNMKETVLRCLVWVETASIGQAEV